MSPLFLNHHDHLSWCQPRVHGGGGYTMLTNGQASYTRGMWNPGRDISSLDSSHTTGLYHARGSASFESGSSDSSVF